MNLEDRYLQSLASSFVEPVEPQPVAQPEPTPVAGTVRPGAMQGEMRAIPETQLERSLYTLGVSLEEAGKSLDKYAPGSINDLLEELRIKKKVPVIGDLRLRDIIPFIGGTEKVEDPRTGETVTKEVGTPQALKMAGRGESLTTGTGLTTEMKPDVKAAAMDVGLTVAPVAKKAGQAAVKAIKATEGLPVGAGVMPVGEFKSAVEAAANPKKFYARIDAEMGEQNSKIISEKMREYLEKNMIPSEIKKNIERDIGQKLTKEQADMVKEFVSAQRALKREGKNK